MLPNTPTAEVLDVAERAAIGVVSADTEDRFRNIEKQISDLKALPRAPEGKNTQSDISGPMVRRLLKMIAVLTDQVLVLQGRARAGDNEFAKMAKALDRYDKPNA